MNYRSIQFRLAEPHDFTQISDLIFNQNREPKNQCIHSSLGDDSASILNDIQKWHAEGEILFALAILNDKIVGVFGAEFDEELGRAWLWGPHILHMNNWSFIAINLFKNIQVSLPINITQFDAYINSANQLSKDFFVEAGFFIDSVSHVYEARQPAQIIGLDRSCQVYIPQYYQQVAELHQSIFPNAYYSSERMIDQVGEKHQIFVYVDETVKNLVNKRNVLGYVFASINLNDIGGEIEFLGVQENARRKGVGRALLSKAMHWLVNENHVQTVQLTVNDKNVHARGLYHQVGFQILYSGIGLRLKK